VRKPKYPGSGEVLRIPVDGCGAYDSVVNYFALLAYPMPTERAKCIEFSQALKTLRYKLYLKGGGDRAKVPDFYRGYKNEAMAGRVRLGFRRVIVRLEAASMALCIYFDGLGVPYDDPTPNGSVGMVIEAPGTVNKAAEDLLRHTRPDLLQNNETFDSAMVNIKHRVWAASLPVLHLAIALIRAMIHRPGFPNQMEKVFIAMLHDPQWLSQTLDDAERIRFELPSRIPTFRAEQAIRLLPTETRLIPRLG